jgi:hypothetical protein
MGGFRLLGPNYTIQSLPEKFRCKCMGYKGEISEKIEQELVSNPTKELPLHLKCIFGSAHIGDNLLYKIIHKHEDEHFEQERERLREKKEKLERNRLSRMGYDNWTPWDGKSLHSVATREVDNTQ